MGSAEWATMSALLIFRRVCNAPALFSEIVSELAALDRHERRALSRRKFAIRAFVRVCVEPRDPAEECQ